MRHDITVYHIETRRVHKTYGTTNLQLAGNFCKPGFGWILGKLDLELEYVDLVGNPGTIGNGAPGDPKTPGRWTPPPEPAAPVEVSAIEAERDRRLAVGFDYDFGDERGVHRIGTTETDMLGWAEVSEYAQSLINTDQPDATVEIDTNTGPVAVTAVEWQSVRLAFSAFRQPIWLKSFEIAAMNPIPFDYAADARWPPS